LQYGLAHGKEKGAQRPHTVHLKVPFFKHFQISDSDSMGFISFQHDTKLGYMSLARKKLARKQLARMHLARMHLARKVITAKTNTAKTFIANGKNSE
jgi:hypothetical protein